MDIFFGWERGTPFPRTGVRTYDHFLKLISLTLPLSYSGSLVGSVLEIAVYEHSLTALVRLGTCIDITFEKDKILKRYDVILKLNCFQ
jgi:hypothetical protein